MAGDRSQPSQTAEQTEERTVSSDRFDDVVESVDGLKQSVDELDTGSSILFDESPSPIEQTRRRGNDLIGGSSRGGLGLPDTSTDPPLGFDPSPSNRQLEKRLNRHGRRLKKVEERLDGLVDVLASDEQRPVGEVLQDVLDDEITRRQAAAELGWSQAKVSQVVTKIHE